MPRARHRLYLYTDFMLIAQAVLLAEHTQTYTHKYRQTDRLTHPTDHPTHATAAASMADNKTAL